MVQLIHCKPGLAGRVKLSMTAGSNASWLEVDEVLHAAVIRWALIWWATPPHRLPDVDRHRLSKYSLSEAEDTTAPGGIAGPRAIPWWRWSRCTGDRRWWECRWGSSLRSSHLRREAAGQWWDPE